MFAACKRPAAPVKNNKTGIKNAEEAGTLISTFLFSLSTAGMIHIVSTIFFFFSGQQNFQGCGIFPKGSVLNFVATHIWGGGGSTAPSWESH